MLRSTWRGLETESRLGLYGHERGNPGHRQGRDLTDHRASPRPYQGEQITAQERAELILQIEDENVPAEVDRIVAERVPSLEELTREAYVEAFRVTLGVLIAMVLLAMLIAAFIPRIDAAGMTRVGGH
jgi:hypothetical protein